MGHTVADVANDVGRRPKASNKRKMLSVEELRKIVVKSNEAKCVKT